MPAEWLASIAGSAVAGLLRPRLREAYAAVRDKAMAALAHHGPLEVPLEHAYAEACQAFLDSLRAVYEIDEACEARIRLLMEDDAFLDALRQLPFVPYREIDTRESEGRFEVLRLPGADEDDFHSAWTALRKRFFLAAAKTPELRNLLSLTLAAAQEERAAAIDEKIREIAESIKELLRRQGDAPPDDEPAVARYRETVDERYRYAETRALFLRETGQDVLLEAVFVETPLVRGDETLPVREILGRERLTVVLGPPGSGKSTLLRCLTMALCRPGTVTFPWGTGTEVPRPLDPGLPEGTVPVLCELKAFAAVLAEDPGADLAQFLLESFREELPPIEALLTTGRILVLLDGLDEIFDPQHRRRASEEVSRLVARYTGARFVVTSRPQGYEAAPLPGTAAGTAEWHLASLGDEGLRRLVDGWLEALPVEFRTEGLVEDVLANPRLRALARNPLLATLLVLVRRSRPGRLPERRAAFFEAAVEALAGLWDEPDLPEPGLLVHALAEAAWRAFSERGRREIDGEDLRSWLRESLACDPDWEGERGEKAAGDLLRLARERAGILTDLGDGRYQIVHLSLHEYLVAQYVLDRLDGAARRRVVLHYLHAPQWQEALRLAVTGAGQAQAEGLVRAILAAPTSEHEDQLWRDLRFVCRCVADRASLGPEVREEVRRRAAELGIPGDSFAALADTVPPASAALLAEALEADHVRRASRPLGF